jgi:hypothetical protein
MSENNLLNFFIDIDISITKYINIVNLNKVKQVILGHRFSLLKDGKSVTYSEDGRVLNTVE